jgi:hypothetical protein
MEVKMKRFTVASAVFGVSILVVWAISLVYTASQPQVKNDNTSAKVQPAPNEAMEAMNPGNEAAIPATGSDERNIAPVFDASGAVVSDPSGTILNAASSAERKVAPVLDANGMVVSDPSGVLWSAGSITIPVTGADRKVAPVFDATGAVVSDPTGTILNAGQP